MSREETAILDFSDPKIKRSVLDHIATIRGLHWFEIRRCRNQRSLSQNAYLWGVVYKAVQAGLEEAWGERKSVEWIHCYLKAKFLAEPVVNKRTGEVVDHTVGSSADLDTKAFGVYIDQIIQFAAHDLNVEIPIPLAA